MEARSTIFCMACGVENPREARFCAGCGAAIGASAAAQPASSATSSVPPTAGTAVVREAIVASPLQRVAQVTMGICGGLVAIVVFMGFGVDGLEWGHRGGSFLIEIARPAPGYLIGAFLILFLNPAFFRRVAPRRRDAGMAEVRSYRRTLRTRDGIRLLLAPGGLRAGVVVLSLLWIGIGAIAWYNFGNLGDEGFDVATGMYAAMAIPVAGLIATACMWPIKPEVVYMDRKGAITRG